MNINNLLRLSYKREKGKTKRSFLYFLWMRVGGEAFWTGEKKTEEQKRHRSTPNHSMHKQDYPTSTGALAEQSTVITGLFCNTECRSCRERSEGIYWCYNTRKKKRLHIVVCWGCTLAQSEVRMKLFFSSKLFFFLFSSLPLPTTGL